MNRNLGVPETDLNKISLPSLLYSSLLYKKSREILIFFSSYFPCNPKKKKKKDFLHPFFFQVEVYLKWGKEGPANGGSLSKEK